MLLKNQTFLFSRGVAGTPAETFFQLYMSGNVKKALLWGMGCCIFASETKNNKDMATLTGIGTKFKGSVGEYTFYRRMGSTVAKQKVDRFAIRKASEAQLANRVRWSNLVSFWSSMHGLLSGTFSRKGRTQTDFNAFMSHNLGICDVYLTRDQSRHGACVAAPYYVSFGVLPSIGTSVVADGRLRTDIVLGDGFAVGEGTTIGDLSRAVLVNNEGYSHGDLIVALAVEQYSQGKDETPLVRVSSSLVQLDACSPAPLSATGSGAAAFAAIGGYLGAPVPVYGGMAWIHLQMVGGHFNVSPQRLAVTGLPTSPYDLPHAPYTTPEALHRAIASYRRD